ncbi:hypothetical protein VSS74_07190 [Conexibacter stalactiti]|uniref:Uncharacterized protein n=1 Tax=Conexibacter stalactiti TaxID=1940611 RepID=A0ABU4HLE3_9ACTN|nr:hypothetical protein [Conexibacter stalactiti]MDW5594113.1 hypothetical protein [Conexibacter stalactiti]MEC5034755.1 hypothetical protein [Conexibacter stalactiti]
MRFDSWNLAAAAGALATLFVATAPATVAAAPRSASPVISPKPGQVVTAHRVKLVVRAGHEHGDLRVTLNGRQIGRDFPLARRGRRTLWIANSHGLRHGRNVLRVRARRGYETRTATVRFTVTRSAPLVGAGRDRSVTAGTPAHLGGHLHQPPGSRRKRALDVRWTVVGKPRGSRVRAVAAAATLRPLLKPDRVGTYTLRMTAGSGASAISDTVEYSAIPADPLVPVDTQLPPSSSSTGAAQPGLSVGGSEYRMAYLGFVNGQGAYFSDSFAAMWQVAAFDRKTLTPLYNRTYGYCLAGNAWRYCRSPDAPGSTYEPMFVDPNDEIMRQAPGNGEPGALVIARTLGRPGADTTPASYDALLGRTGFFGRPSGGGDRPPIVGPTSYIGVPGMTSGEADIAGRFDGSMSGFLIHDQHFQFHFIPGARPTFDTRVTSCTDSTCTIGHRFGDRAASETVPRDRGGYFVTAWDPVTLAFRNQTFATIDGGGPATLAATKSLADFLDSARANGSIIALSTLRGAGMTPRALLPGDDAEKPFARIVDTVAAIGGTRHGFLTSATSTRAEYTVVGWPGAGEAKSHDAAGRAEEARLRGALVPDRASQLRPTNVSSVGPPAERINQMMVRPTSTAWRYPDASSGPGAAIQCIGAALAQGTNIRAIYSDLTTEAAATSLQNDVRNLDLDDLEPVDGTSLACAPAAADFAAAQKQLVRELGWVAHVRGYLTALSTPESAQGGAIWGQALTLGNELDGELAATDANSPFVVDALGFVASMIDLLVPGAGRLVEDGVEEGVLEGEKLAENVTGALSTTSALFWLASTGVQRAADGGPSLDETVAATDLANHLMMKAQAATAAFTPIGDVIVSDPQKLEEVGRWARCRAGVPGGCKAGFEEYAATPAEIDRLTDASLRAMGRTIYGKLVTRAYPSWNLGTTVDPDNPPLFFSCAAGRPFDGAPRSSYAAGFDAIENGQRRWRVFLMLHGGWTHPSQKVVDRMFTPTGDTWDVAGLGMDPFATLRDTPEVFDHSGSIDSCGFAE